MNQDEIRQALFDAFFEYETLKRRRRLKALEKALRGTVMATAISSTGFSIANSERDNSTKELVVAMMSSQNPINGTQQTQIFKGAIHFESGQHILTETKKDQLLTVINNIPKNAEVTVMGHTDAAGDQAYNNKLGMLRAESVADFLKEHGIKINGVGNQLAENNKTGWSEQRVDLIMNLAATSDQAKPTTTAETASPPEPKSLAENTSSPEITPRQRISQAPAVLPEASRLPEMATLAQIAPEMPKPAETQATQQQVSVANTAPSTVTSTATQQTKFFEGAVHFSSGQHVLTEKDKDKLLKVINTIPKNAMVTVMGHTDSAGDQADNNKLGMLRALAVADFLSGQGIKINGIGNQLAENNKTGWKEQRVDLSIYLAATTDQVKPITVAETTSPPETKSLPEAAASPEIAVAAAPEPASEMPKPTETKTPQQQVSATNTAPPSTVAYEVPEQSKLIKGAVRFAFDKHVLTAEHQAKLLSVINRLPQNAEISVIGRTDALGVRAYNEILGTNRAVAVANFLKQHGIKVNSISSQVADNNKTGWRERRVDLIVNEVTKATAQELPQTVNAEPKLEADSGLSNEPDKAAMKQRRQVFGVVHFGFNQHALLKAHRERLVEFLKQIPKDAQLTIIGRTDPSGDDAYNMLLGLKRANNVANYLSQQGLKVKKIGSKVSRNMPTAWHARRVDILIESNTEIKPIHLSQPFEHKTVQQVQNGAQG
jgi:outer membrane protein OmpA-like peptidoglycan-associated protein